MGKKSISEINLFILNFDINDFFKINDYLLPILTAQDKQILESSSESNLDSIAIESLLLSTRSLNALKLHNINTVAQLSLLTEIELLKFSNLGMKSLIEISEAITELKVNS